MKVARRKGNKAVAVGADTSAVGIRRLPHRAVGEVADGMVTTVVVEKENGIHERTLQRLLRLNPELRPATRVGVAYLWTLAERDRVREALAEREAAKKKRRATS